MGSWGRDIHQTWRVGDYYPWNTQPTTEINILYRHVHRHREGRNDTKHLKLLDAGQEFQQVLLGSPITKRFAGRQVPTGVSKVMLMTTSPVITLEDLECMLRGMSALEGTSSQGWASTTHWVALEHHYECVRQDAETLEPFSLPKSPPFFIPERESKDQDRRSDPSGKFSHSSKTKWEPQGYRTTNFCVPTAHECHLSNSDEISAWCSAERPAKRFSRKFFALLEDARRALGYSVPIRSLQQRMLYFELKRNLKVMSDKGGKADFQENFAFLNDAGRDVRILGE